MADWQRTLQIAIEFQAAKRGEMSIADLARAVADKLAALRPFGDSDLDDERNNLVDEFRDLASEPTAGRDDFDEIWDRLYDWADTTISEYEWPHKKVCWVNIFGDARINLRGAAKDR